MIGRKEEQRLLHELASSSEAEFVVIYGRRRIGKTHLVRLRNLVDYQKNIPQ